jgi:hypothetical protein
LLHIGNKYPSVPVALVMYTKEWYDNMYLLVKHIQYNRDFWHVCGDLKVIIFLGLQLRCTKFSFPLWMEW